mmetsp:Transcript_114096/g.333491  ORF Transcript_114096/g.333491 Transcript_114096/m.333491 type:complete len:638 (-) Transcript_114096:71-1984(-)
MTSWEDKAQALGLDEMCMQALRSVLSERAHQILGDIQAKGSEIRNPSAFVSKAARETWDDNETLRRALEVDIWSTVLDDSAKAELRAAGASFALSVLADLRSLGDGVRNPSSYVCATLRKRMAEGKLGGPASGFPAAALAAPWTGLSPAFTSRAPAPAVSYAASAFRTPPPAPAAPRLREVSATEKLEIDMLIAEMAPDLDDRAVERVYQLGSVAEARKALEVLVEMGGEVRNKSAFINGVISKRLQNPGQTELSGEQEAAEVEMMRGEFEKQLDTFGEELDEQARTAMRDVESKLGTAAGVQLLRELTNKKEQGGLRNVSGFAYTMARTRLSGAQAAPSSNTVYASAAQILENELLAEFNRQLLSWGEEIDERARKVLTELQQRMGASVALNVLKELEVKVEKEDIRNVSSFVFSMVRQRLQGAPQAAPLSFAPASAGVQSRQPLLQASPSFAPPVSTAVQRGQPRQQAPTSRVASAGGTANLSWIQETLEAYGLKGRLDEVVLEKMMVAQPERLMEIFQDLADMGDRVRNPSAFIQKSLKDFSEPRKRTAGSALDAGGWSTQKRAHVEPSEDLFARHGDVVSRMDEAAVAKLKGHHDQGRVQDILSEMSSKIADIRNPSAFVVRALSDPSRAAGF